MWISSLVVTLTSREPVAGALSSLPVFTLGELQGTRLPVVLEAPDGATARYWHEWVERLPGVLQVDLAFVAFEDAESGPTISAAALPIPNPEAATATGVQQND